MTLVVEDGTGRSDAESYASSAEADAYHLARGNTSWAARTDKEAALLNATDYMTQAYRQRWKGTRVTSTQALDWPRYGVAKTDAPGGYAPFPAYYPQDEVPTEVKRACMELALRYTSTAPLMADQGRATTSETVGPISVTYAAGTSQFKEYPAVDGLLAPLIGAGSMVKVVRA